MSKPCSDRKRIFADYFRSTKVAHLLFGSVLLSALIIRLKSAWFGYPLITHPDEPKLVTIGLRIFNTGDFNPHFFHYPSLVIYLQVVTTAAVSLLGKAWGYPEVRDIPLVYFHVAGRIVAAVGATLSIVFVYLIGRKMAGVWCGVIAAALVSFSPIHINNSALVTTDIWVAVFAVLVLFFSVKLREDPSISNYLFAGAFVGLATSSKYTAVTFFSAVVISHCFSGVRGWLRIFHWKLAASGIIVVALFLATTPYAILDHREFLSDIAFESTHYRSGHPGNESVGDRSYLLYANVLWSPEGLGLFGMLSALMGMALLLRERSRRFLCIVALPLVLFLFVGNYKVFFSRNIVSLIPALSLAAAYAFALSRSWLMSRRAPTAHAACLVVLLLVFAPLSHRAYGDLRERLLPDTRWESLAWVNATIPRGSVVAREAYTPPLNAADYTVIDLGFDGLERGLTRIDGAVDYVILSSRLYGRFFDEQGAPRKEYERQAAVYRKFFSSHRLIYELKAIPEQTTGPTIRVYENALHNGG